MVLLRMHAWWISIVIFDSLSFRSCNFLGDGKVKHWRMRMLERKKITKINDKSSGDILAKTVR